MTSEKIVLKPAKPYTGKAQWQAIRAALMPLGIKEWAKAERERQAERSRVRAADAVKASGDRRAPHPPAGGCP